MKIFHVTEAGKAQQKEIREILVQDAMRDLWERKASEMANAVQSRVRSILATHVVRKVRAHQVIYTLLVPELDNKIYTKTVSTESEYAEVL